MRTLRVVLMGWILTGGGAALGYLVGLPFGRQNAFLASVVLGTLAILLTIRLVVRFGWFNGQRRRGGSIGALCGFALSAPLAVMNLDRPAVAFGCLALVGVGMILGAGPVSATIDTGPPAE
jgi:hypothetical protein